MLIYIQEVILYMMLVLVIMPKTGSLPMLQGKFLQFFFTKIVYPVNSTPLEH